MKYCPGGSYLVIKGTPRVTGYRKIMAIGYKYNYRNVLWFISTEGGGITEPIDPYLSHYPAVYRVSLILLEVAP